MRRRPLTILSAALITCGSCMSGPAQAIDEFIDVFGFTCDNTTTLCRIPTLNIPSIFSLACKLDQASAGYTLTAGISNGSAYTATLTPGKLYDAREGYIGVIAVENASGGTNTNTGAIKMTCVVAVNASETREIVGYVTPKPYSRISTPSPIAWRIGVSPASSGSATLVESPSATLSATSYGTKSTVRLKSMTGTPSSFCSNVKTYLGSAEMTNMVTSYHMPLTGSTSVKFAVQENIAANNVGKFSCTSELEITTT